MCQVKLWMDSHKPAYTMSRTWTIFHTINEQMWKPKRNYEGFSSALHWDVGACHLVIWQVKWKITPGWPVLGNVLIYIGAGKRHLQAVSLFVAMLEGLCHIQTELRLFKSSFLSVGGGFASISLPLFPWNWTRAYQTKQSSLIPSARELVFNNVCKALKLCGFWQGQRNSLRVTETKFQNETWITILSVP